jgi:hypothetical protein
MQLSDNFNAPVALFPGKEARYLLDRKLSGSQSRSGLLQKEKKFLVRARNQRFLGFPARSLVTIPAELTMSQYNVYCSHKISLWNLIRVLTVHFTYITRIFPTAVLMTCSSVRLGLACFNSKHTYLLAACYTAHPTQPV